MANRVMQAKNRKARQEAAKAGKYAMASEIIAHPPKCVVIERNHRPMYTYINLDDIIEMNSIISEVM